MISRRNSSKRFTDSFSRYVHRTIPSYSDVGIRLEHDMNWLSTEPITDEILTFMKNLHDTVEICSSITLSLFLPTVMKFRDKLHKQNILTLLDLYRELGNIEMQKKLESLLK